MWHLMDFWLAHGRSSLTSATYAFAQPSFVGSLVGAVASSLYFIAFCGVPLIASDVEQMTGVSDPSAAAGISGAAAAQHNAQISREVDTDVLVFGCGCAGASLATQLSRQGKRVTVIERSFVQQEKIIGELLQPGGIR